MKLVRYLFILALIVGMAATAFPALAQEGTDFTAEELEWIDFVASAYENTLTSTTLQGAVEQTMTQNMRVGTTTIDQTIALKGEMSMINGGELPVMYAFTDQTIEQVINGQDAPPTDIVLEMTVYDGIFYMRYGTPMQGLPEGWFEANTLFPSLGMGEIVDFNALTKYMGGALANYPVNKDTVASITELDPEKLDGVGTRVFEMEWNLQNLFSDTDLTGMVDLSSLGIDMEDYWQQFADKSTMSQRIWIGLESGLILKVEQQADTTGLEFTDLAGVPGTLEMDQVVASTATYSNFGEPVEIEKPVLGE